MNERETPTLTAGPSSFLLCLPGWSPSNVAWPCPARAFREDRLIRSYWPETRGGPAPFSIGPHPWLLLQGQPCGSQGQTLSERAHHVPWGWSPTRGLSMNSVTFKLTGHEHVCPSRPDGYDLMVICRVGQPACNFRTLGRSPVPPPGLPSPVVSGRGVDALTQTQSPLPSENAAKHP